MSGGIVLVLVLYAVGLALLVAEIFVPGAFVGTVGGVLILAAIYLAFRSDEPLVGAGLIFVTIFAVPFVVVTMLRRISLTDVQRAEEGYKSSEAGLGELLWHRGVAETPLRPAGIARISGKRVDVVAENRMIAPGTEVEVVLVEGNRVVVRPVQAAGEEAKA